MYYRTTLATWKHHASFQLSCDGLNQTDCTFLWILYMSIIICNIGCILLTDGCQWNCSTQSSLGSRPYRSYGEAWNRYMTSCESFSVIKIVLTYCPPPFAKAGELNLIRPSVPLSVTKTLTWLISSEVLMIEHWYLACMILVTGPFNWHHIVTLTFDLLQGQICCRAGDHNSPKFACSIIHVCLKMKITHYCHRSSGGQVVKLLACGARGPGFDSRPRHLNFQRLVISCFQVEIWLKDR